jgi:hypothetical protein
MYIEKKKKNLLSVDGTVISYNDHWELHFSNRYLIINLRIISLIKMKNNNGLRTCLISYYIALLSDNRVIVFVDMIKKYAPVSHLICTSTKYT